MFQPHYRKKKNGIPVLSKKEINEIAEGYVLDFCPDAIQNPQPLNIDLFIESYLDLTLDFQYLSNDARYLGMMIFSDTTRVEVFLPDKGIADYHTAAAGTIIIDNTLTEDNQGNRYRYTCGHEAGHWVFHRSYYNYDPNQYTLFESDNPYIKCRELSPHDFPINTSSWDDKKWMEWQADKFSSCFLMPKAAVRKLLGNTNIDDDYTEEIIILTSRTFQVSFEAATYRLMDLGYIKSGEDDGQLSFI